jgi:hypothetical protein
MVGIFDVSGRLPVKRCYAVVSRFGMGQRDNDGIGFASDSFRRSSSFVTRSQCKKISICQHPRIGEKRFAFDCECSSNSRLASGARITKGKSRSEMTHCAHPVSRNLAALASCAAAIGLVATPGCKRSGVQNGDTTPPISRAVEDPAASFNSFVREAAQRSNGATPVRLIQWTGKWDRCRFNISDVKMDVRKTDSLVTPILGLVSFVAHIEASIEYGTEAQAREAETFAERLRCDYDFNLRYRYNHGQWSLIDGTQAGGPVNHGPLPLTIDEIKKEPDTIPLIALKEWVANTPAAAK